MALMVVLIILFSQVAYGADLPSWISRPPTSDGIYKYYVGRSSDEKNLNAAWRVATQDAYETAIRENFGVATSIQVSNFETLERKQLDKRVDEKSQRVRLEQFEQRDSFVDRKAEAVDLYLLFRYPVVEIEKERERLLSATELPETEFTEIGENSSRTTTTLRIETVPNGADVYIDENRWGVTPLLIKGALPIGIHDLSIRHPRFQDVNEKMVLIAGKERGIKKVLQPAQGWLRVTTIPSNAQIAISGRSMNFNEVDRYRVAAGQEIHISASHPDCDTIIRVVKVEKNEVREVHIELPMLPSRRALSSKTARDLVDSREFEESARASTSNSHQNGWIWGLGTELGEASSPFPFNQPTLGFGLTVERRFLYRLGLKLKLMYDMGLEAPHNANNSNSSSSSGEGISGTSGSIGIPIYFSSGRSSYYLMPEVGRISRTIPETYLGSSNSHSKNSDSEEDSYRYDRKGLTLGYQNLDGHYDFWVSHHIYDWREQGEHSATLIGISFTWGAWDLESQ